jgi:exosortase A-associated hydrolase 2
MQQAFFLNGGNGDLFCIGELHPDAEVARESVLIVPPFAEEMNKSRHLMAALARRAGHAGYDVLLFDFFGTGDSEGDFADASIRVWRSDIDAVIRHMNPQVRLHIVGFRAGALIAVDATARHAVHSLTLVHPQLSGKQQLDEMLRLRLTASLMGGGRERISALRRRLLAGDTLEIAGYRLSPELASGLDALALTGLSGSPPARVNCVEVVSEPTDEIRTGLQHAIDDWRSAGSIVNCETTQCGDFWATREISPCPALVDNIVDCLSSCAAT